MPRGRFVSFEGSEGCGKSTQLRLLAGCLKSAGRRMVLTCAPVGTEIGEQLRMESQPAAVRPLDAAGSIDHLAERIRQEISPRLA